MSHQQTSAPAPLEPAPVQTDQEPEQEPPVATDSDSEEPVVATLRLRTVLAAVFILRLRYRRTWRINYFCLSSIPVRLLPPEGVQQALIELCVLHANRPRHLLWQEELQEDDEDDFGF